MKIYLLERGDGVSDGVTVKNEGVLPLVFEGIPVDGVFVGGRFHPVTKGRAEIPTRGLEGLVNVTARNSATRRAYSCENLLFTEDIIVPVQRFVPSEYIAMAVHAEAEAETLRKKIKNLEAAVFGVPLFGKEE